MRRIFPLALLLPACYAVSQAQDWLVSDLSRAAPTTLDESTPNFITLSNGLLSRTFSISPCFATVELELLSPPRAKLFRGLSPEASLTLNGTAYDVGGCLGQSFFDAFALESLNLTQPGNAFRYVSHTTLPPSPSFPWVPGVRHSNAATPWPPRGLHLAVTLAPPIAWPPFNNSVFAQFPGMGYGCAPSCPTGWPSCDNSSLPGQCAWPRGEALAACAAWPGCLGVNCHLTYPYCCARQAPVAFEPFPDYISYVRVNTSLYAFGDTTIVIHYEMYDGIPALRKWVEVAQGAGSAHAVVVDDLVVEQLRAPNFAPDQITVMEVQPNNPTPFDQQVVPEPTQSFPGRTRQLWFFDPQWDQGGDAELHVPYSYYSLLRVGYDGLGPGAVVPPGSAFSSVSERFVYHDSSEWERQGLGIRRVQSVLAPQLLENPSRYMITDISSNATFQLAIEQAAAAGFELVIVGYGAAGYCGMCPAQLNDAAWVAWFKSNVDFARARGVGVSVRLQAAPSRFRPRAKERAMSYPSRARGPPCAQFSHPATPSTPLPTPMPAGVHADAAQWVGGERACRGAGAECGRLARWRCVLCHRVARRLPRLRAKLCDAGGAGGRGDGRAIRGSGVQRHGRRPRAQWSARLLGRADGRHCGLQRGP
jgi:hypothetical protein